MNDPIVDEIRRVRDEYAARFNYDLDAIYRDLKEQEKKSGRTFVRYGPAAKAKDAALRDESSAQDNSTPEGINASVPDQQGISAVE